MIPADLLKKYHLPEEHAMAAIEVAIARTLTEALRTSLSVRFDGDLEIRAFPAHGKPVAIFPAKISRKLRRYLFHQVELELQKRQALHEAAELKQLRGVNVTGEISRITADGTIHVTLEIADFFRRLILSGEYPVRCQPPRERGRYRIGEVLEFHVNKVVPIITRGRTARVRIWLSRTAKDLPVLLLRERTGIGGIECRRRVAGEYSDIFTPAWIPKDVIKSVGKELGEHLNVFLEKAQK